MVHALQSLTSNCQCAHRSWSSIRLSLHPSHSAYHRPRSAPTTTLTSATPPDSTPMSYNDQLNTGVYWRTELNSWPRPPNAPSNAKWYPKCHICANQGRETLGLVDIDDTSHTCPACGHRFEGCESCTAVFRWKTAEGELKEWRFPSVGHWRMR
jgi:hypothetical protein